MILVVIIIKYLRQYAHSHWSISVFRWEYANTVVTSLFLCFPGTTSNHFQAISLTLKWRKLFQVLIWGLTISSHLSPRKESKKRRTTALVSNVDDLVEGAQAKTTKYATKYGVNVFKVIFAFNYYNKILKLTFCFF